MLEIGILGLAIGGIISKFTVTGIALFLYIFVYQYKAIKEGSK